MVYSWKSGARMRVNPQEVGEVLAGIERRDAATVVAVARVDDGALHDCFEWDDEKASEAYRLEQARYLLRHIVVVEDIPGEPEPVTYRAFEAIDVDEPGAPRGAMVYVETRAALEDVDMREQIMQRLERTIAEAESTASRYMTLVPAFGVTRDKLADARASVRA